jgi:hypothetical protein
MVFVAPRRVQSRISDERSEVACSLVEHWLFGPSVATGPVSTSAVRWNGTQERGASGPSTLLGPEGTAAMVLLWHWETNLGQDRFPSSLRASQGPGPPVS